MRLTCATVLLFFASGCATVLSSSTDTLRVDSKPQGITVKVDGQTLTTPAAIELSVKMDHEVIFPNGEKVMVKRVLDGTTFLNVFFWPGFIVDGVTGATTGSLSPTKLYYVVGEGVVRKPTPASKAKNKQRSSTPGH